MIGAIAGDIIGSIYERVPIKTTQFPLFSTGSRFTDDTVLTVAVAQAVLTDGDYAAALRRFGRAYPDAGYGSAFFRWLMSERGQPYNSWGNGSAMRVSPIGFAFDTLEDVLREAAASAAVTHNHPEGIKGAQATALAVFLGRGGESKEIIRAEIEGRFGYDLQRRLDQIRPAYGFDISCQGTVPEALIAFLESRDFEDALRNGISLGGDSDTIGAVTGGIAQAHYGQIPEMILHEARRRLPPEFLSIIDAFTKRFAC